MKPQALGHTAGRGRLQAKLPNSRPFTFTTTSTSSSWAVPLGYSHLDSLALFFGLSASGFAPPPSFDEFRALGDNIPSASLHPVSLKIHQANLQKADVTVDAIACLSDPSFRQRFLFPQLLGGVAVWAHS